MKQAGEIDYSEYFQVHSGYCYNYMDSTETTFWFETPSSELPNGLDRLAQLFMQPLFRASLGDRVLAHLEL